MTKIGAEQFWAIFAQAALSVSDVCQHFKG